MLRARLPKISERTRGHSTQGAQPVERRAEDAAAAPDAATRRDRADGADRAAPSASAGRAASGSIADRGSGPRMPAGERAAVSRAREAGGPLDQASYVCCCGYAFTAPVSTGVRCPVCGSDQAW